MSTGRVLAGWCVGVMVLLAAAGAAAGEAEPAYPAHPELSMQPVPAGLGVNIHFYKGNDQDLAMLEAAGVGIIRMDVSWSRGEPNPGEYDFSQYEQLVSDLRARNMRLLFIIDYGNPHYDDGLSPYSEECRAAYARFCGALAKRFADDHVIWELWNEPNISFWKPKPNVDDYMAWCKAVVPAIREADPTACIIAPATSGIAMTFLDECFERGLLELVDGVSVHPYRSAAQGPETALPEYRRLESLISKYCSERGIERTIPILSGEWGYTTTEMSREQHGKYLARQWLTNMSAGIPISIWYDWHDDGKDPEEREHNFGTVTWDYQPKDSYTAMKTLIAELGGYMPVGRVPLGDEDDFAVLFRNGDDWKLALWTVRDAHEADLGAGVRVTKAVGHLGDALDVLEGSKQPATDAPRYLELAKPLASRLLVASQDCLRPAMATAGLKDGARIEFSLDNPTARPLEVALGGVALEGARGQWEPANLAIPSGGTGTAVWTGTVFRRDLSSLSAGIPISVTADGEETCSFTKAVDLAVTNPLDMQLAWGHDGLMALLDNTADEAFTGRVECVMDGGVAANEMVTIGPGASGSCVLEAVKLDDGPKSVGLVLRDGLGHVVARVEPMTYALIDAFDHPDGTDLTQAYRLWTEGDADREGTATGVVTASPGENPPFPMAARVDYDIRPGWCFWQLGPKGHPELPGDPPKRAMMWVYGDDRKESMRCRLMDTTGQTFQPNAGMLTFEGWRPIVFDLERRIGGWGGADDGVKHYPLRWQSYYLQDPARVDTKGTTYLTGVVVAW